MLATIIGLKLKTPKVYNQGTEYETTCDEFLFRYSNKSYEDTEIEVKELNKTKPDFDRTGRAIDWDKIKFLFVEEQIVFED